MKPSDWLNFRARKPSDHFPDFAHVKSRSIWNSNMTAISVSTVNRSWYQVMATVLAKILDGKVALDGLGVTVKIDGNKVTFWGFNIYLLYCYSFFRALFGNIVQSETRSIVALWLFKEANAQKLYSQQRQQI